LIVDSAKKMLGTGATAERIGDYWSVKDTDSPVEIVFHAEKTEPAEMRLQLSSGLLLGELETAFGPSEMVSASKTSSVSFRVGNLSRQPVSVFVRRFTFQPSPESQVLGVLLRTHPR
jgi:hypothetical protein